MNNTNVEKHNTFWVIGKRRVNVTITSNSISDEAIQNYADKIIEISRCKIA